MVSDEEAESDCLGLAVVVSGPVERLEDVPLMARRNTGTVVRNGQGSSAVAAADSYFDLFAAVSHRVAEQAPDDLSHTVAVCRCHDIPTIGADPERCP